VPSQSLPATPATTVISAQPERAKRSLAVPIAAAAAALLAVAAVVFYFRARGLVPDGQ
jgi:hypothetical protein